MSQRFFGICFTLIHKCIILLCGHPLHARESVTLDLRYVSTVIFGYLSPDYSYCISISDWTVEQANNNLAIWTMWGPSHCKHVRYVQTWQEKGQNMQLVPELLQRNILFAAEGNIRLVFDIIPITLCYWQGQVLKLRKVACVFSSCLTLKELC